MGHIVCDARQLRARERRKKISWRIRVFLEKLKAQWTRSLYFNQGIYHFHLRMDDGAVFWLDDRLVIEIWQTGSARERTVMLELEEGNHDLRIEYFDTIAHARIHFWWESISKPSFVRNPKRLTEGCASPLLETRLSLSSGRALFPRLRTFRGLSIPL